MPNINLFYGYWDYWDLYHKVTFDGINRLILVNEGETVLDVQRDLYSAWKEWSRLETNLKYLQAFATVGGEPTVEGQFLDVTYFLINGWKIKAYPGAYNLTLIGNIFDIDGGNIQVPPDSSPFRPNNITVNTNTSVIVRQVRPQVDVTITGSGLNSSELSTIENTETLVETINTELGSVAVEVASINSTLNTFYSTTIGSLDTLSSDVSNLSASVSEEFILVNSSISTLQSNLTNVSQSLATQLNDNFVFVTTSLNTLQTNINELSASLLTIGTDTTFISQSIGGISTELNSVSNTLFTLNSDITNISASVNTTNDNVLIVSESVGRVLAEIGGVQVDITDIKGEIFNISGSLVEIESLLRSPVTASLVDSQQQALFDIQAKMTELWKLHGLEAGNPLVVTNTSRTTNDITQTIATVGTGSAQSTTVIRQ